MKKNATEFYVPQLEPRESIERRLLFFHQYRNLLMNLPHWNWCGICALSMILKATKKDAPPVMEMYKKAFQHGAYKFINNKVVGAYHQELANFIETEFKLKSYTAKDLSAADVGRIISDGNFFIASVTPDIRCQPNIPDRKNGHLILVFGSEKDKLIFHNSTGFSSNNSQVSVEMGFDLFEKYFSGRGIIVEK